MQGTQLSVIWFLLCDCQEATCSAAELVVGIGVELEKGIHPEQVIHFANEVVKW